MKCARCDAQVEQDGVVEAADEDFPAGTPVWSENGSFCCEWYVGHDENGRFAPTHEVDDYRMRQYDVKYDVHDDAYADQCPDCQEQLRKEQRADDIDFVANFFRMKLDYDKDDNWELATALVDAIKE